MTGMACAIHSHGYKVKIVFIFSTPCWDVEATN